VLRFVQALCGDVSKPIWVGRASDAGPVSLGILVGLQHAQHAQMAVQATCSGWQQLLCRLALSDKLAADCTRALNIVFMWRSSVAQRSTPLRDKCPSVRLCP
jgi:hypothetical protein